MSRPKQSGSWSAEDAKFLRDHWGWNARYLQEHLGRSRDAILAKAYRMQLPAPSQGLLTLRQLSQALGVDRAAVQRLLKECGTSPVRLAPVSCGPVRTDRRWLGYELDPLRHFLELRDKLTISPSAWALQHGPNRRYGQRLLSSRKLYKGSGPGYVSRLPEAVFNELLSGQDGNWCAIWRTILTIPEQKLTCARWFLALVTEALGGPSGGWVRQYVPAEPLEQARLVQKVMKGCGEVLWKARKACRSRRSSGPLPA